MHNVACKLLLVLSASLFSLSSYAEYAVIVNPANGATISKQDIERLYLAKAKTFPDGSAAAPLNQEEASSTRSSFDNNVVGKSESQMKAYWAKLLFTGKAVPIKQVGSDQDVINAVASDPSAIGYIDASSVNDSVKVVLTF